jgi:hypothetical protein
MAVTRIKNNQITDATITAQKIANQTLVGSLFSPDLTLVSNLSIVGNLTVTGNTSNINAINTFVTDPFVIFNNGYNGSLANYTIGFLVNRNLASLAAYGAVNTAWVWSESDGAFVGIATTDTGSGITSINNSGYANVKVGNLEAVSAITASTFNIGSAFIIGGSATTLAVTNLSTGNAVISGGYISSLSNATVTTGNAVSWYAAQLNSTTGNITTLTSTTVDAGTTTTAVLNSTTGNITTLTSTTVDAGTTTTAVLNSTTGNITTLVATNFSTANAQVTGGYADNFPIGANTAAPGTFTTVTATTVNAGTTTTAVLNSTTGNITTLGVGTTTTATLNSTTGNITTLGVGTTTTAVLNSTTGNITTLNSGTVNAGTTTTATVNTTTANITNGSATTLVATNFSSGNSVITAGSANSFKIGNATPESGAFTTLSSTGSTTFTNATQSDNSTTGAVVVTGGVGIGANLNVAGNVTILGNLLVQGNTTTLNVETLNVEDLNVTVAANATTGAEANGAGLTVAGANATFTYLNADDSWNLNKKLNATTLQTSGNIIAASGVNATNFTTGALVVPGGGGVGITGDLQVQGASTFQGNINAGNISLSGNINVSVGAVQSSFGVFFGNAGGIGALYAGTSTFTPIDHTVLQLTANIDNYSQVNFQNRNSGSLASSDIVATADNGDDFYGYINLGIASSAYNDINRPDFFPNDGYLVHHGVGTAGNLIIISEIPDTVIRFRIGDYDEANAKATVTSTGFRVNTSTASTSTTSGALIVDGGVGVRGNIHAAAINATPVGNTIPSTGAFTTVTATDSSAVTLVTTNFSTSNARIASGYADSFPVGANTAASGAFTTLSASSTTISQGNIVAAATTASTNTTTGALVVRGGAGIAGAVNIGGQIVTTAAGSATDGAGQLYLNGATSNRIDWAAVGTGAPSLTTRSAGTKVVLYPSLSASNTDYAIGIDAATMWSSVPENGASFNFKWYGAATEVASLSGTGVLKVAGNIVTSSGTASTSTTTGALVIVGGAGISSNLTVGLGAEFNSSKTASYDFLVRGVNDNTLIWARPSSTYDAVVIGNSATTGTLVNGAKLIVNTTDSIIIPVGTTAQRPGSTGGTDAAGMIRFNSSTDQLEYHDGTGWNNTGTTFTVIAADSFDGDDSATIFTLGAAATTNSCIVSINGVVQIPTTAYSVSGTTLTFTSPPATGDKIDVRRLTTTSTVTILQSQNGYVAADAQNDSLILSAGTSSLTERLRLYTNGNINATGNINTTGTITSNGNIVAAATTTSTSTTTGALVVRGGAGFAGNINTSGWIIPSANVSQNLGTSTQWWNTFYGVSTQAQYADLAENYQADQAYPAGTVLEFGGQEEVTVAMTESSTRVAGIVSSNPAHLMNGGLRGSNVVALALVGRVPCNVIGPIHKGDMMVSAGYGYARASSSPIIGSVIGKALENFEGDKGVIEVVVGRV